MEAKPLDNEDHSWQGRGKVRVARRDGRLMVRCLAVTSRGGRLQTPIAEFFRKDYRKLRPGFGPFSVTIWVEMTSLKRRLDVDNVAKACLDALTGVIWHDDSQVRRLTVEKMEAAQDAVTLDISPFDDSHASRQLSQLLADSRRD